MTQYLELDHILPLVKKPGRYIGHEINSAKKSWQESSVRFCLIFPDLYEVGMSHQGLQILYHILNSQDGVLAERCFTPDLDMEKELQEHAIPLFSLETRTPLSAFDIIGITLPYELCYTNILTVLSLACIPFRSKDRDENHPLILGGGSCSMNPEPVADFFDAIVLGDGEHVIIEIATCLAEAKTKNFDRAMTLESLAKIEGIYVPAFFDVRYEDETIAAIEPLKKQYPKITRRVIPDLNSSVVTSPPLVPTIKTVHDRLGIEIARGCTRGCRFCQAGIIYRPVRERNLDDIFQLAQKGIEESGFDELALLSLSTGDYSCLLELMVQLMDRFTENYVSVSMPSMRVGTLTPAIMNQINRVRKTGFTVAPEAGTDRLREVINKGITEEDLLETCSNAFEAGWKLIKFYFMIGLPTETMEDVESIVKLAQKARKTAQATNSGNIQINVSVSTFVPKPHTPFQWDEQISLEDSKEKINKLKKMLPRRGFKLKWHDPYQSALEGVFSRGDRRLSTLIETAWNDGVRLDSWSEHYHFESWQQAAQKCGVNLEKYLRKRDESEILPWSHLDSGVDLQFLKDEREKAETRSYTPDCRAHGCQKCGLCDFKTIQPRESKKSQRVVTTALPLLREKQQTEKGVIYRVRYSRLIDGRFLGHLDLLQLVFRIISRIKLPVMFSQGFNPSPKVSFSPALPVGVESLVEYFDMELATPLADEKQTMEDLNHYFPDYIQVLDVCLHGKGQAEKSISHYEVTPQSPFTEQQVEAISSFNQLDSFLVERIRKRKRKQIDIRPLVQRLELVEGTLLVEIIGETGRATVNPLEILEKVVGMERNVALLARIKKVQLEEVYASC